MVASLEVFLFVGLPDLANSLSDRITQSFPFLTAIAVIEHSKKVTSKYKPQPMPFLKGQT